MRVLVTGGTGFIGSNLVGRLLQNDHDVFVLTRQGTLDEKFRLWKYFDRITLLEGDQRNYEDIAHLREFSFDVVFNLAAYNRVGESFQRITEVFEINAIGASNLARTLEGTTSLIHISSSEVYGDTSELPIGETTPCNPTSPYAMSKLSGEIAVKNVCEMRNIRYCIVRPFNSYGPMQSVRAVIPELILCGLKEEPFRIRQGTQIRDFVYVDDLINGLVRLMDLFNNGRHFTGPINFATGKGINILDLANLIKTLMKSNVRIIIGGKEPRLRDISKLIGSYSLAEKTLEWEPRTQLESGIAKTIKWMTLFYNGYIKRG